MSLLQCFILSLKIEVKVAKYVLNVEIGYKRNVLAFLDVKENVFVLKINTNVSNLSVYPFITPL